MIHKVQHNFTPAVGYIDYPYKRVDDSKVRTSFSGAGYIKKDDLLSSSHPFAVSKQQYMNIINTFCEIAAARYIDGRAVTIPHLGTFRPVKSDLTATKFHKTLSTRFRGGIALMLEWIKPFTRSGLSSMYSAVFHRTTFDKLNALYNNDDAFFNRLEESVKAKNNKFNKLKADNR